MENGKCLKISQSNGAFGVAYVEDVQDGEGDCFGKNR